MPHHDTDDDGVENLVPSAQHFYESRDLISVPSAPHNFQFNSLESVPSAHSNDFNENNIDSVPSAQHFQANEILNYENENVQTNRISFDDRRTREDPREVTVQNELDRVDDRSEEQDPERGRQRSFLLQWNPNGFYAHHEEFQLLALRLRPFIICVQETLLRKGQSFKLKGYRGFSHPVDRLPDERVKGGVGILLSDDCLGDSIPMNHDIQLSAARIKYPVSATVASLYLPPGDDVDYDSLERAVESLPKPRCVTCDVNARNELWGSDSNDSRGKKLVEIFCDRLGMMVMNNGSPTHYSAAYDSFSAIDVTFIDPELNLEFEWNVYDDLCFSDHFPIHLDFLQCVAEQFRPISWALKDADWTAFECMIEYELDCRQDEISDVNEFCLLIESVADQIFEKTKGRPNRRRVPWWDDEVKQAIRDRKKAFRKHRRKKTPETLMEFRKARAKARSLIRRKKREKWEEKIGSVNCHTPVSELWSFMRCMNGKTKRNPIVALHPDGGDLITEPTQISEEFATRFAENSSNDTYGQTFDRNRRKSEGKPLRPNPTSRRSLDVDFTAEELEAALKSCHDGAPGPDKIPFSFLKHLPRSAKSVLLSLFNNIWKGRTFPPGWKEAFLIPVLKPGKNPDDPDAYRPISLTNCICKLLEKMVNNRLVWYLERKNLLSEFQFGFRGRRSTSDVHLIIESEAQAAFKAKEHLVVLSIDMTKAYDRMWRRLALEFLIENEIGGNMYAFLENFMSGRVFKVTVAGKLSEWHTQEQGVPQGSVLSVTLFLLGINKIDTIAAAGVVMVGYADDWYLIRRHKNMKTIEKGLQTSLNRLKRWSNKTGFSFSAEKTKAIHICRSRKRKKPHLDPVLNFNGQRVKVVDEMNVLGLTFDKRLKWDKHINSVKQKARLRLNVLKALCGKKNGADEKMLLQFQETLVLSVLEYGAESYGSATKTVLNKLDSVHHDGLRLATGAFRTSPIESLYALSGKMSLANRRKVKTLTIGARIAGVKDHPLRNSIKEGSYCGEDSFLGRLHRWSQESGIDMSKLEKHSKCLFPPWKVVVECDLTLSELTKAQTLPVVMRSKFLEILSEYRGYTHIYTDGSKDDERTGAAVVCDGDQRKWRLPNGSSVFSAEADALCSALQLVEEGTHSFFLVCTDSLSSLMAIKNGFGWSKRINRILEQLYRCQKKGKSVNFLWIPSHVGIGGNEAADFAAKQALDLSISVETRRMFIEDVKPIVLKRVRDSWKTKWETSTTDLRVVKPDTKRWTETDNLCRREQTVINRLRIGHTRLTHSYYMERISPPVCEMCGVQITVNHLLWECVRVRGKLSGMALGNDSNRNKKVIEYLKDQKLFDLI